MEKEGRNGFQEKGFIQLEDCGEGDGYLQRHQVH
jgi:hypothetical protein